MTPPTEKSKITDLAELRKKSEERVAAEAEQIQPDKKTGEKKEFESRFVLDCLHGNALGDGILFTALHRDRFVFCKTTGEWLVWTGHSWRPDEYNMAAAEVEAVAEVYATEIKRQGERLAELTASTDEEAKGQAHAVESCIKLLRQRIYRLRDEAGRQNCLKMAATNREPLAVLLNDLDTNNWQLACPNGVVDLRTGLLHPGNPRDYNSRSCSVAYNPAADYSLWMDFFKTIYENDQEKIRFVIRLLGYGITGMISEHVFPVFQGRGRNGKGLLIEAVAAALGDYAGAVPAEMLLDSNRSSGAGAASPEIMLLKGLRFAYASETDENRRFSAARVKWLTGGDTMVGRNNYDKKLTRFTPTHLLVLLTNPTPDAPPTDFAFWARCMMIKHRLSFVKHEPIQEYERKVDPTLEKRLYEQLPGLLRLLVEGCMEWQEIGLAPPAAITGETQKYQEQMNVVGRFVDTCIKTGSAALETSANDIYDAFVIWFNETEGNKEPSQKWFGGQFRRLERFDPFKREGKTWYRGLELNPEYCAKVLEYQSKKGSPKPKGDDSWSA